MWEAVADMQCLESLKVRIGSPFEVSIVGFRTEEETHLLRPLLAVVQPKSFEISAEWHLIDHGIELAEPPWRIKRGFSVG